MICFFAPLLGSYRLKLNVKDVCVPELHSFAFLVVIVKMIVIEGWDGIGLDGWDELLWMG